MRINPLILYTTKDELQYNFFKSFKGAVNWFERYSENDFDKFDIDYENRYIHNSEIATPTWNVEVFDNTGLALEHFYSNIKINKKIQENQDEIGKSLSVACKEFGKYVHEKTFNVNLSNEKHILEAIEKNPFIIQLVFDPSYDAQLKAIKGSPNTIKYIDNPEKEIQIASLMLSAILPIDIIKSNKIDDDVLKVWYQVGEKFFPDKISRTKEILKKYE